MRRDVPSLLHSANAVDLEASGNPFFQVGGRDELVHLVVGGHQQATEGAIVQLSYPSGLTTLTLHGLSAVELLAQTA